MWKLRSQRPQGHRSTAGVSNTQAERRRTRRRSLARRVLACENLEARRLLACGADVCVDVQFVDPASPATELQVLRPGRAYEARVFIQDDRGGDAAGIFQAYFDVIYDASLISLPSSDIQHGAQYSVRELGDASLAGSIDAAGGTSRGIPDDRDASYLLFQFAFQTDATGTLTLDLSPDNNPSNRVEFFPPDAEATDIGYVGNSISIQDNDPAGIVVTPTAGLETGETGGLASFQISLTSQPTANVRIPLSLSDATEGTLSTTNVVFTPGNWNVPQTVSVRGMNDNLDDGDVTYRVVTAAATSSDGNYNGRNADDVELVNIDDDTAGITVNAAAGLTTSEAGTNQSFSVRLDSQPAADVVIGLSSSDPGEGTPSPASLRFTAANWNVAQTVTVAGVDDSVDDGDQVYTIRTAAATSGDANYNGLDASDVSLLNQDNDVAGYVVDPTSGLTTSEDGGFQSFTVRLQSQPTANVSLGVAVDDTSEGSVDLSQLTFSPANWQLPQAVRVTGVDDDTVDGDVQYRVRFAAASSTDAAYQGTKPNDLVITNTDDDVAGVRVDPTSGLVTGEGGPTASFTVVLTSAPTANVTIDLSSSDAGEGVPGVDTLTFTPANWDVAQTVTVTGVDDDLVDGAASYAILTSRTSSTDPLYNNRVVADVSVTNQDNDAAAAIVTPTSGLVTGEDGAAATFTVRLSAQPTTDVSIPISSSNGGEGRASVDVLTFTAQSWNVPQTVTVTGVDDEVADGEVVYSILTGATSSADAAFNGLVVDDVSLTNLDDDEAGVVVDPVAGLLTGEDGAAATFTVRLSAQPTADVTIGIVSSAPAEGTVDRSQLVFTSANWNTPQTITVAGQDDLIDDGDVAYSIFTQAAVSDDAMYDGLDPDDVSLTNLDDDVPGIAVVPTAGLQVSESGQSDGFELVLTSQPTAEVTIPLSSSAPGEATLATAEVTFTPANWNTPQWVTVTGVDDDVVDGTAQLTIQTGAAQSADPIFSGLDTIDVAVQNLDDDRATLSVADVRVTEGDDPGDPAMLVFTATVSHAVAGGFSVDFATVHGTASQDDYTSQSGTLRFDGSAAETRTVSVPITAEGMVEADETVRLVLSSVGETSFGDRIDLPDVDATGTIENDDTAALAILGPASVVEGTGGDPTQLSFSVRLTGTVQDGFSVDYATVDGTASTADGDYVQSAGTLNFTGTADEIQTLTVTVAADDRVEPDEVFQIVLPSIDGVPATVAQAIARPAPHPVTITNDDFPRLLLSDATASSVEGSGGTTTEFRFRLTLSDAVNDTDGFEVPFQTVDGTASAAAGDYQSRSGTVRFTGTAGEVQTVSVLVNHDAMVEADETFAFSLGAITGLDAGAVVMIPTTSLQAAIVNDDVATVLLTAGASEQDEGGQYRITATLSAAVQGGLDVDYATQDDTATVADDDYSAASGTLTFAGTTGEQHTFVVQTGDDDKVERDEAFEIVLARLSGLPESLADAITLSDPMRLTIRNEDAATVTLSPAQTVLEGDSAVQEVEFTVTVSAAVDGGFSVPISTQDGTAAAASDYTAVNQTLTFSGSAAEAQTLRVPVASDEVVEGDETFTVLLGQLQGLQDGLSASVSFGNASSEATIQNDDTAMLTLAGPGSVVEGTADTATTFRFTVRLDAAVQDGLDVAFATQDGSATVADADYQSRSGVLTFSGTAGESQTVDVLVTADDRVEPDETFVMRLGDISGLPAVAATAVQASSNPTVATIVNDDFPRLQLVDVTPSNLEGTSPDGFTEFRFAVALSDDVDDADGFQVPVQIQDGTARVADGDYLGSDTVLQFSGAAGQQQVVTVRVRQDAILENDETFTIALGAIDGLAAGQTILVPTPSLTATILDDDSATLSLQAATDRVAEGDQGATPLAFAASLSAAVQGGFTVAYQSDDRTATTADGDYVDSDGVLAFAGEAGETQSIEVLVNGDSTVETDETFAVSLGAISGLDAGALERLTVVSTPRITTIENDDAASLRIVGPGTVVEGTGPGTSTMQFTVTLDHAVASGFTVAYQSVAGTATLADDDYTTTAGELQFAGAAGETHSIRVPIGRDAIVEDDETISVQLTAIEGLPPELRPHVSLAVDTANAVIANDDSARIGFVSDASTVLEADGTLRIGVRLDVSAGGSISQAVSVNVVVRAGGTAAAEDFVLQTATVTFPAGSTDGTVRDAVLTLTDDGSIEDAETILLALEKDSSESPAVTLGEQTLHTATVIDDAMDATLAGRVWVDANGNQTMDVAEMTLPGVTVRLRGTTLSGETVQRTTTTDQNGAYRFIDLPAGEYELSQVQPAGFLDAAEVVGRVGSASSGRAGVDKISEITLGPSQQGTDYLFAELGLEASAASRYRFLARPRPTGLFGNAITAEMLAESGNDKEATAAARDAFFTQQST